MSQISMIAFLGHFCNLLSGHFRQHCTVIIATLCNNGRRVRGMTRPPCSRTRSLGVVTLKVAAMVVMVAVKITTKGFQHVHIGDRKVSFSVREDLLCDLCLAPFDLHFIRFPAQTHDVCERPVRKDLPEENTFSFGHRPNYPPPPALNLGKFFTFLKTIGEWI